MHGAGLLFFALVALHNQLSILNTLVGGYTGIGVNAAPVLVPSCSGVDVDGLLGMIDVDDSHLSEAGLMGCRISVSDSSNWDWHAPYESRAVEDGRIKAASGDLEVLERRSFFSHITHAISHVAHAVTHPVETIKNAVHTVAHAVTHPIATVKQAIHTVAHAVKSVGHAVKHVAHAITHPISTIKHAVHSVQRTIGHAVHAVKHAVHSVVHTVRHAVHRVAHAVRHIAHTVKEGIKDAAHFIKTNGPTIAKIGLKMLASSQGVLATVAKVIPGAGIPLSKGLRMEAKGLDMASGMIHANVPKGWQTAMDVMDVAEDPIGHGLKKVGLNGAVGAAAGMILG